MVAPGSYDGNDPVVYRYGKLPVVEPFLPFMGCGPIGHISRKEDGQGLGLGGKAVHFAPHMPVVPRIATQDQRDGSVRIGWCGMEVEGPPAAFVVPDEESVARVRFEVPQSDEGIDHASRVRESFGCLHPPAFRFGCGLLEVDLGGISADLLPTDHHRRRRVSAPHRPVATCLSPKGKGNGSTKEQESCNRVHGH